MYLSSDEVCDVLYREPSLVLSNIQVTDPEQYNQSVKTTYAEFELLNKYIESDTNIEEFDSTNQNNWFMPGEYKTLDITQWVLEQCENEAELQRCAEELLLFQDRNLFGLLCYCKYLVDTMRKNNVVMGVGRGSRVASFVLYKIGIHRINSLFYSLPIEEFLK